MHRSLSIPRIALATAAVALLALVGIAALKPGNVSLRAGPESWLALAPVSMDAHELPVRQLLLAVMAAEQGGYPPLDPRESLAMTCGMDAADEPAEQYTALIGDWVLAQDPDTWRIKMIPQETTMWVSVNRHALLPPPPPGIQKTQAAALASPYVFTMPIERLAGIREAWSSPDIWKQAEEWRGCTDGRPAFFEACIHGKYVASRRVCGEAGEAIDRLWARMQSDLPVPPRSHIGERRNGQ